MNEKRISELLMNIGARPDLLGYRYTIDAVLKCWQSLKL